MDGLIMRSLAGVLVIGLALWGPMPFALAQVEITQEVRQACERFDPEIRDIALNEVVPKLEAAGQSDASPEAKQEAHLVEATAQTIGKAGRTAAQLPTPDVAELQKALTQNANVAAPVAQELAQRAQTAMEQAKSAFKAGDPGRAEATMKAFQEECRTRGVDPGALGKAREGGMTFDRIAFDHAGDFMGRAMEVHIAADTLQRAGVEFTGAPPSPEEARKMIDQMNVSSDEKAKMLEMAKAYEGFCKDGNFKGIEQMHREAAEQAYRQAMEHGTMPGGTAITPEMAAKMATEMQVRSPMDAYKEWVMANPDMAAAHPEYATMATMSENMRTMEAAAAAGTPTREVMEQMAYNYREAITSPTSDAPRTETSGTSTTTYETKYADGHTMCPPGKTHVPGAPDGPSHCI